MKKEIKVHKIQILWKNGETTNFNITGHHSGFRENDPDGFIYPEGAVKVLRINTDEVLCIFKQQSSILTVEVPDE